MNATSTWPKAGRGRLDHEGRETARKARTVLESGESRNGGPADMGTRDDGRQAGLHWLVHAAGCSNLVCTGLA
jgi:hypothetical protein